MGGRKLKAKSCLKGEGILERRGYQVLAAFELELWRRLIFTRFGYTCNA